MNIEQSFEPGEVVYIIIRNPHAQGVANVQQAAVVRHPEDSNKIALFVHDHYYPLSNEVAIFPTEEAAETAYHEAFGSVDGEYYG